MADRPDGVAGARHAGHDLELVARAAAGDAATDEARRAHDLFSSCGACAALDADLRAIAAATRSLAPSPAVVRAPRDFRLTPADAARLRSHDGTGLLARLRFGSPVAAARLGTGLAALGLVGILVAVGLPGALVGGAGGSGGPGNGAVTGASKDAAASPEPALAPGASPVYGVETFAPDRAPAPAVHDIGLGRAPIVFVLVPSACLVVAGLALLLASWAERRAGP